MYSWEDYTNPKNKSCDKWQIVEDVDGNLRDVEYEAFSINFIASKAQVLPSE